LAELNFSEIEDKGLPLKDWSKEIVYDAKHSFGRIFKVIPSK